MKRIVLYAVGVYALVIGFGVFLKFAHGSEINTPQTCAQYLKICEKSCLSRQGLLHFACSDISLSSESEKYKCLCGDEFESEIRNQRTIIEFRKLQALLAKEQPQRVSK